jgi:hypothetical protein
MGLVVAFFFFPTGKALEKDSGTGGARQGAIAPDGMKIVNAAAAILAAESVRQKR